MENIELKEINIWSVVKISFFVYAALGLAMGIFYYMIVLFGINSVLGMLLGQSEVSMVRSALTGMVGVLFTMGISLFYALFGTFLTVLIAFIYNIAAKFFGGITLTLAEKQTIGNGSSISTSVNGDSVTTTTLTDHSPNEENPR